MIVLSAVDVNNEYEIVAARQTGRNFAKEIGFRSVDQARITTAITELARNIYLYAGSGKIILKFLEEKRDNRIVKGLKIIAKDDGPGISNIKQALKDGYTTSGGLGAGLPGVKRLMDEFRIISEKGQGTVITVVKWLR